MDRAAFCRKISPLPMPFFRHREGTFVIFVLLATVQQQAEQLFPGIVLDLYF